MGDVIVPYPNHFYAIQRAVAPSRVAAICTRVLLGSERPGIEPVTSQIPIQCGILETGIWSGGETGTRTTDRRI